MPTLPLLDVRQASSGLPCNVSPYQASATGTSSVPRSRREEASATAMLRTPDCEGDCPLACCSHPKVVSERLGHATISITLDTYSHAIPAMQEEAAALIAGLVLATE